MLLRGSTDSERISIEKEWKLSCARMRCFSGLIGITADTITVIADLRRELDDIGVDVNPAQTVALPPKEHAPMAEELLLLESIDALIGRKTGDGGWYPD